MSHQYFPHQRRSQLCLLPQMHQRAHATLQQWLRHLRHPGQDFQSPSQQLRKRMMRPTRNQIYHRKSHPDFNVRIAISVKPHKRCSTATFTYTHSHTNAISQAAEWVKQLNVTWTGTKIRMEKLDVTSALSPAAPGQLMALSVGFRDDWITPRDTSSLMVTVQPNRC